MINSKCAQRPQRHDHPLRDTAGPRQHRGAFGPRDSTAPHGLLPELSIHCGRERCETGERRELRGVGSAPWSKRRATNEVYIGALLRHTRAAPRCAPQARAARNIRVLLLSLEQRCRVRPTEGCQNALNRVPMLVAGSRGTPCNAVCWALSLVLCLVRLPRTPSTNSTRPHGSCFIPSGVKTAVR